jgi:two-component system LytT family response regulator
MKNHLTISTERKVCKIPLSEIIHIKSNGMHTTIFTEAGSHCCSKNLKEVHHRLKGSPDFFRTHTSHIVNFSKIKEYQRVDGGILVMTNGSNVPIARRRKSDFLNWFMKK